MAINSPTAADNTPFTTFAPVNDPTAVMPNTPSIKSSGEPNSAARSPNMGPRNINSKAPAAVPMAEEATETPMASPGNPFFVSS